MESFPPLARSQVSVSSLENDVILPWDRFSHWLNSILVVTFDIEMGQSLEHIYPSPQHVKLTANEKANICYMAFPDSNSGFLGDTQHHFRIKQDLSSPMNGTTDKKRHLHNSSLYDEYNQKTLTALEVDKNHLFGFVYFRQVKDKSLKRGYFQKSVVLLSKFPFMSLFSQILALIAQDYFSTGGEVIETGRRLLFISLCMAIYLRDFFVLFCDLACHDIDQWALPMPGEMLSLPILGNLIEVSHLE